MFRSVGAAHIMSSGCWTKSEYYFSLISAQSCNILTTIDGTAAILRISQFYTDYLIQ